MTGTDREARARMRIEDIVVHCALNDGTAVRLRTITPDDAPLIREGIAKLSAESRYLRFFSPAPVLPENPAPLSRTSTSKSSPSRRA